MECSVLLIGKRMHGHHMLVTKGMLSEDILDGMNQKGWILSRVEQLEANFHYDFIRQRSQRKIS